MVEYTTEQLNVLEGAKKTIEYYIRILNKIKGMSHWEQDMREGDLADRVTKGYLNEGSNIVVDKSSAIALRRYGVRYFQLKGFSSDENKLSKIEGICSEQLRDAVGLVEALNTLVQYGEKGDKEAQKITQTVYNRFPKLKPENSQ